MPCCKEIVQELLKEKESAFHCRTGDAFVGLGRNMCKATEEAIKAHFPKQLTLKEFLLEVVALDNILVDRSLHSFETFDNDMSFYLQDSRLLEVLSCFEKYVAERFVENYFRGLRECRVLEERSEGESHSCLIKTAADQKY